MILDNAKYHQGNLFKEYLDAKPHIILEFLPTYSPEPNTIERVWKIIRSKSTHTCHFQSIADLIIAVKEQFDHYSRTNNVLKKLCAIT